MLIKQSIYINRILLLCILFTIPARAVNKSNSYPNFSILLPQKNTSASLQKRKKGPIIQVMIGVLSITGWLLYIYTKVRRSQAITRDQEILSPVRSTDTNPYKNLCIVDVAGYTKFIDDRDDHSYRDKQLMQFRNATLRNRLKFNAHIFSERITDMIFNKTKNSIAYVQGRERLVIIDLIKDETTGDTWIQFITQKRILRDLGARSQNKTEVHLFSYEDNQLCLSDGYSLLSITREEDELEINTIYRFNFTNTKTITQVYQTEQYIYGIYEQNRSDSNDLGVFRVNKENPGNANLIIFDVGLTYPFHDFYDMEGGRYTCQARMCPYNANYIFITDTRIDSSYSRFSLWDINSRTKLFEANEMEFAYVNQACNKIILFDGESYHLKSVVYNPSDETIKVEDLRIVDIEDEITYHCHAVTPKEDLLFISFRDTMHGTAKLEVRKIEDLTLMKNFNHDFSQRTVRPIMQSMLSMLLRLVMMLPIFLA
ncbi:MAG: hypothetical protein AAF770_02530 [Bacteroidota bacterium]